MTDLLELSENIEAALNQETFDVLEFVTGDLTPKDEVVIYTDAEAGYALDKLVQAEADNASRAESEGLGITDELTWVDPDEVDALRERIEASALTFELKGMAPQLKKAIRSALVAKHGHKESDDFEKAEPFYRELTHELIARSIVQARRADGKLDKTWTAEKIATLDGRLHPTEFGRLDQAVYRVNSDTDVFDRAVSADFLSKR